jgi:hypothetical protein
LAIHGSSNAVSALRGRLVVERAVIAKYSASLCQPDDGDDRMNEKDDNIAHLGMLSKTRKTPDHGPIQQFAGHVNGRRNGAH